MASEYQQTTEKEIQDRVKSKYSTTIAQLTALGFEELCFVEESLPALGISNGFLGLFGVLIALPFEVSRVGRNLRASIFSILMVSRECDTYVSPFGLGLKFYTSFTDGTCVITGNFNSQAIKDDKEKLYKSARPCSITEAWQQHQDKVNALTASGKQRKYQLSFDEYAKLNRKEDNYIMKSAPFASGGFTDFGSMSLSVIMFLCLLVAAALLFASLPIIIGHAYPACEFVKNVSQFSLLRSFLAVPVGIVFSWLLARIQKNTFALDGIGTALRGHLPSPDARGYIATKWLVFMELPILPVRSYQVDGEYSKSIHPRAEEMRPLPELHWDQIWETVWQSKWWYALAAVVWIGVGVWSLSKCV